jgi:hypothetical protein
MRHLSHKRIVMYLFKWSIQLEHLKNILELLYLLSGPALVFFAYKALEQIKVTKDLAKINAKREAYKVTADESRYFSEKIIPLINILDTKVDELGAQVFLKSSVKVENNTVIVKLFTNYPKHDEIIDQLTGEFVELSNALSDFSTYFVSGIADEKLAYNTLGRTYCDTVKKYAPLLVLISNANDNVIQLFVIWNNRAIKDKALIEKRKLEETIKNTSEITVEPIGT